MAKGMGFKAAAASVQSKSGVPAKAAKAIIAAGARKASPAAKKANPNLNKVKPAKKAMADPPKGNRERVNKPAKMAGKAGGAQCAEGTPRQQRLAETARKRTSAAAMVKKTASKKLPSQSRISGQPNVKGGTAGSTGSRTY